jgi:preprotein translocase subunit SecD
VPTAYVQLPGVQDTAEAKRMIGATATLEYRAVVDGNAQDAINPAAFRRKRRSTSVVMAAVRSC